MGWVTFSDLESHFCCLKPFHLTYFGTYSMYYLLYVHTEIEKCKWLVLSTTFSKTKTSKGYSQSHKLQMW